MQRRARLRWMIATWVGGRLPTWRALALALIMPSLPACQGEASTGKLQLAGHTTTGSPGSVGNDRPIDGDTDDPSLPWARCGHYTGDTTQPAWWGVDLGSVVTVTRVKLYNRQDCCPEYLQGVNIYLGTNWPDYSSNPQVASNLQVPGNAPLEVVLGRTGQYLYVEKDTARLTLCEAEVFAVQADAAWHPILRYGTSAYTPTSAAVNADSIGTSSGFAKLADTAINSFSDGSSYHKYKLTTTGSKSNNVIYVRTDKPFSDTSKAFGWSNNYDICINPTQSDASDCSWMPQNHEHFDTIEVSGNTDDRWFSDYDADIHCFPMQSSSTRCFADGITNGHAMRRSVVVYKFGAIVAHSYFLVGQGNCLPNLPQWAGQSDHGGCRAVCSAARACLGYDHDGSYCRVRFARNADAAATTPPHDFQSHSGEEGTITGTSSSTAVCYRKALTPEPAWLTPAPTPAPTTTQQAEHRYWKVANAAYTGWRPASDVRLYSDSECGGTPYTPPQSSCSGEYDDSGSTSACGESNWRPQCSACQAGDAWIALDLGEPKEVGCIRDEGNIALGQGSVHGNSWNGGLTIEFSDSGLQGPWARWESYFVNPNQYSIKAVFLKLDPRNCYVSADGHGNSLAGVGWLYQSVEQCFVKCLDINGCNSIQHCPSDSNRCYVYNRVFNGSEPAVYHPCCDAYYRVQQSTTSTTTSTSTSSTTTFAAVTATSATTTTITATTTSGTATTTITASTTTTAVAVTTTSATMTTITAVTTTSTTTMTITAATTTSAATTTITATAKGGTAATTTMTSTTTTAVAVTTTSATTATITATAKGGTATTTTMISTTTTAVAVTTTSATTATITATTKGSIATTTTMTSTTTTAPVKSCTCTDGTAATGTACTADGAAICSSCDVGYHLSVNMCRVSKEMIPEAMVAQVMAQEMSLVRNLMNTTSENSMAVVVGMTATVAQSFSRVDMPDGSSKAIEVGGTKVEVPASIMSVLTEEPCALVVTAYNLSRGNDEHPYQEEESGETERILEVKAIVNINFMSVNLSYKSIQGLVEPIKLSLPVKRTTGVECAFWNETSKSWSTEGLTISKDGPAGGPLVCETRHLSLFAAIVRGFVAAFECSQVSLLNAEAIAEIGKGGDWLRSWPAGFLFGHLTVLLFLMVVSLVLDRRRSREGSLSDEQFLIALRDGPDQGEEAPEDANDAAGDSDSKEDKGASRCRLMAFLGCLAGRVVTWAKSSSMLRDALDEVMSNWCEYFSDMRSTLESIWEESGVAERESSDESRWTRVLTSVTYALVATSARRSAGASAWVSKDCVAFMVEEEEELRGMLLAHTSRGQGSEGAEGSDLAAATGGEEPAAGSSHLGLGPQNSERSNQGPQEERWLFLSGGGPTLASWMPVFHGFCAPSSKDAGTDDNDLVVEPACPQDGVELPPVASVASGAFGSGPVQYRASRCTLLREQAWHNLHTSVAGRLDREIECSTQCCSLPGRFVRILRVQNPFGATIVYCSILPSSIRTLFFMTDVCGALMLDTLFFEASGGIKSKKNRTKASDCQAEEIGDKIGRLLAVGGTAVVLAMFLGSLLGSLHERSFKKFDYEGCPEWNRQLRNWRIQDRIIWITGVLFCGFCIFFVLIFLANALQEDLDEWLVAGTFSVLTEVLLIPASVSLFVPMLAVMSISLLSCAKRVDKKDLLQEIRAKIADRSTNEEASSDKIEAPRRDGGLRDRAACSELQRVPQSGSIPQPSL